MPRTLNLEQLEGPTRALLDTALSEGEPVLLLRDGEPVAVLASPAAMETARLGDLPRWEEWLHEMKESITTGGGRSAPAISFPEPPLMDKTMLGFDLSTGTLGSDDGRDFLRAELVRLRVPINDEKLLAEVYAAVLALCEDKERLYEDDVRLVAQKQIAQAPQRIRLLSVTVTSATGLPATAEVTVELGHGPAMRREQGDGPLDAAFKALQRLVSLEPEVENFSVVAATPGSDALAEAVIALSFEGGRFLGAGASTNAIEAGVQAYVNALNFLLEERPAS